MSTLTDTWDKSKSMARGMQATWGVKKEEIALFSDTTGKQLEEVDKQAALLKGMYDKLGDDDEVQPTKKGVEKVAKDYSDAVRDVQKDMKTFYDAMVEWKKITRLEKFANDVEKMNTLYADYAKAFNGLVSDTKKYHEALKSNAK